MKYFLVLKKILATGLLARLIALSFFAAMPTLAHAHDIPSRVTVYAFVKPEGNELTALLRVPMEALSEVSFPLRGPADVYNQIRGWYASVKHAFDRANSPAKHVRKLLWK